MRTLRLYSLIAAAIVLAVGPAQGTTYSSLSSWQAAVNSGSVQTVDFSGFSAFTQMNNQSLGTSPNNLILNGTGVTNFGYPFIYNDSCCAPSGFGSYVLTGDGTLATHGYHLAFNQTTNTAFGVNLWTTDTTPHTITVTITFADNSTTTFNATNESNVAAAAFTGYTGTQGIASIDVSITATNIRLGLDNFAWGQASAQDPPPSTDTVEATTIAYVGMGILAIIAGRRRRQQLA